MPHVLDNPVWSSLCGRHRSFGRVAGAACRYDPDVSPFGALDPAALAAGGPALEAAWRDLGALLGPEGQVGLVLPQGELPAVPAGWTMLRSGDGLQMTAEGVAGQPAPATTTLGTSDVEEMTALVHTARPGPFLPRTVELGTYTGHRVNGRLVAMAGERMAPLGFTEISAVSTDPAWRRRGLASALVAHVIAGIRARGDAPFLHVDAGNSAAVDLYRRMGFDHRVTMTFTRLRPPGAPA